LKVNPSIFKSHESLSKTRGSARLPHKKYQNKQFGVGVLVLKTFLYTSSVSDRKREGALVLPHSKNITKQLFKNYFLSYNWVWMHFKAILVKEDRVEIISRR